MALLCAVFGHRWFYESEAIAEAQGVPLSRSCDRCGRRQSQWHVRIPESRHRVTRGAAVLDVVTVGVERNIWVDDDASEALMSPAIREAQAHDSDLLVSDGETQRGHE